MRMHAVGCTPLIVIAVGLALGCSGGPNVADPERVANEERRLIAPFETEQTIVANDFEFVMTANFYPHLSQGTTKTLHEATVTPTDDGGTRYEFRPKSPGAPLMKFSLGNTQILVEKQMCLTVLGGRHELTLDATGNAVSLKRGAQSAHVRRIQIRDGVFERDS